MIRKVIYFLVVLVVLVWVGYWLTNGSSPQAEKGCKMEMGCCGYSCVAEETETKRGGGCIMFCPRPDYSWQICGKNSEGQCGWRMSLMGRVVNVFKKPIDWVNEQKAIKKRQEESKRAKDWKEQEEKRIRELENEAR